MTHYPDIRFRKLPTDAYNIFEVVEDCEVPDVIEFFTIPRGFKTDFASIPRWLWSVLPPHGRAANAAIAHDFRYTVNMYANYTTDLRARHYSDMAFYRDMIEQNVSQTQAWLMYQAVRWFGKGHWEKAKRNILTKNR